MRITWIKPEEIVEHELTQAAEEGRDVAGVRAEWEKAKGGYEDLEELREIAPRFWDQLTQLPAGPWEEQEPSDLDGIFAQCAAPSDSLSIGDPANLRARVLGGWLGRAAGCVLGKPVEGKPRAWIRQLLESSHNWPLSDYFTADGIPPEVFQEHAWHKSYVESLRENIVCMPEDDDLNYSMLNLSVAEAFGPEFTPENVLQTWLTTLPVLQVFTAERVAYFNALHLLTPPETATYQNPYREWIGAQIRADLWGWVAPGNPRLAAELAYRDAVISHTKNGIYGEMYFAAVIAASFGVSDIKEAIEIGLDYIPRHSRLSEAIRFTIELCDKEPTFELAMDRLVEEYGEYHWVHTINNAALLVAALLYGNNDFEQTICYAVMGGWDTDCNGATAGSILGVLLGSDALPTKWAGPLQNRIRTSLHGFDNSSFDELAERTLTQIKRFTSE
ncbi:MAG TPA: ADP-ribosylglycohydrolase family protein [Limnochordia bacterium]|nr:ADP-ribosylglycohydrolase family protein [Limnochordia bacterium]